MADSKDQGSGIRDQGSGIRDQGSGIRDQLKAKDDGSGHATAVLSSGQSQILTTPNNLIILPRMVTGQLPG